MTDLATAADPSDADSPRGVVARWGAEIDLYDREARPWAEKGRKVVKRYKDERGDAQASASRFNVLWSNIQTLLPAAFGRNPKPEVERRFKSKDPVARAASEVLERALSFVIATTDFKATVRSALLDRLLPGRGVLWARYVPHMRDLAVAGPAGERADGAQLTDDAEVPASVPGQPAPAPTQEVYWEEVAFDYVHWEDFGHTQARTWSEVRAVWRRVFLTRKELVKRFGEIGARVPLTYKPAGLSEKDQQDEGLKKAVVYEIWDKAAKQAVWICRDYAEAPLDTLPDPLQLEGFWPTPRPLFATLANDGLMPVPDYVQYQDQAQELDDLTARIAAITKAVKVAGVYDSSALGLERLLSEGVENRLIPVEGWAKFAEKGGLEGAVQLLPMKDVIETLLGLYEARDKVKETLYEITGMPDIIRGANDPSSTATAERIKGQFGSIRLRDLQDEVQRFVRELLAIAGQVIAGHFACQTLAIISGVPLPTAQEKALLQQRAALLAQAAQPPQPGMPPAAPMPPVPPLTQDEQDLLAQPTWEEVEQLLRDGAARAFRIDIETDSTIGEDEEIEREQRLAMVKTLGEFIQQAVEAAQSVPQVAPVLAEVVMYVVRSFKNARTLEGAIEQAMEKLVDLAEHPPEKADPEMAKVQGQLQLEQVKQQGAQALESLKLQNQQQLELWKAKLQAQVDAAAQQAQQQQVAAQTQIEAQHDVLRARLEAQGEQMRAAVDQGLAQIQAQVQLLVAQMNNAAKVEVAEIAAQATLDAAQTSAANAASGEGA